MMGQTQTPTRPVSSPSYEGSHPDPGLVPALHGPSGDEAPVHLEHLPVHRVRRGAGPAAGELLLWV